MRAHASAASMHNHQKTGNKSVPDRIYTHLQRTTGVNTSSMLSWQLRAAAPHCQSLHLATPCAFIDNGSTSPQRQKARPPTQGCQRHSRCQDVGYLPGKMSVLTSCMLTEFNI